MSEECRKIRELLPWHLTQTLDEADQRAVARHLESCEECRIELQETIDATRIYGAHIPNPDLTDWVEGALKGERRQAVAAHLGECETCRELVELSRQSLLADRTAAERRPRPTRVSRVWRGWAVAASVTTLLVLSGWLTDRTLRTTGPQVNIAIFDLFGADLDLRSAPNRDNVLQLPAESGQIMLILHAPQAAAETPHSLEILDAEGRISWRGEGLRAQTGGNFTVTLPVRHLPAGRSTLRLIPTRGPTLTYALRVERASDR